MMIKKIKLAVCLLVCVILPIHSARAADELAPEAEVLLQNLGLSAQQAMELLDVDPCDDMRRELAEVRGKLGAVYRDLDCAQEQVAQACKERDEARGVVVGLKQHITRMAELAAKQRAEMLDENEKLRRKCEQQAKDLAFLANFINRDTGVKEKRKNDGEGEPAAKRKRDFVVHYFALQ